MHSLRHFVLFITLILSWFLAGAKEYTYTKGDSYIDNLHNYLSYHIDSTNDKRISTIRFLDFAPLGNENFGYTKYTIWYKFQVHNQSPEELLLQIDPEWTSNIELFKIDTSNNFNFNKKGGLLSAYQNKDVRSNKHLFELKLAEQEYAVFYIKINGDHIISPHFIIGKRADLMAQNRAEGQLYFIYIGIIVLLIFYNLFFAFVTKKRSLVYYSFYIFCMVCSVLFNKGYPNEWFDIYWLSSHHTIFSALATVFILLSIGSFIQIKERYPTLYKYQQLISAIACLGIVFNFLHWERLANEITIITVVLGASWGLLVGFKNLKNNDKIGHLILIGYIAFSLGGIVEALQLYGYLPYQWMTVNAYFIGSGIEMILLSISFGMNVNVMKQEKYRAQMVSLELIKKNEKLILNQKKELEIKVNERTKALHEMNEELQSTLSTINKQHNLLEASNKNIKDSISYSKKIQDALLPDKELVERAGLNIDIFYQPKDVLSGDFYWFGERKNKVFIAAADCTGHGVPGAMLSISGHSLLNRIVFEEKIIEVDLILNRLHKGLIELLRVDKTDTQDGMDIQLICLDKQTGEISYAGASNPLYWIDENGELHKIVADRFSIGGTHNKMIPCFSKKMVPRNWQNLFLFSDGFQDQFNEQGKKFMVGNFKKSLVNNAACSTEKQIETLKKEFLTWQGNSEQTDDVLLISIKNQEQLDITAISSCDKQSHYSMIGSRFTGDQVFSY